MKNVSLKLFGISAIVVLIYGAVFSPISVFGQDLENQSEESLRSWNKNIEGTWRTVVTQRNCETGAVIRSFQAVLSFHNGGTLSGDSAVMSPALKSPSYGVWRRERGWREYSFAFMFFRFNPDGTLAGSQRVRQSSVVQADGNHFTSTGTIEVLDVGDNVIATGCATSTGTRFE